MYVCDVFFFNDTATTEIYTLSLHDALPIWPAGLPAADPAQPHQAALHAVQPARLVHAPGRGRGQLVDRKSTRLNSSHANISYAVFCLKKKKTQTIFYLTCHFHYLHYL